MIYPKKKFYKFFFPKKFNGKKIVHYHVMKTGGSSINSYFYSYLYNHDFENMDKKSLVNREHLAKEFNDSSKGDKVWLISNRNYGNVAGNGFTIVRNRILRKLGLFSFTHSHNLSFNFLDQKNFFCFTVIRDPVERFISLYKFLYELKLKNISKDFGNFYSDYIDKEIMLDPNKFIQTIKKNKFLFFRQIGTFSKDLNLNDAIDNLKKFDSILKQSNLQNDFDKMLKKIGLDKTNNLIYGRKSKYDNYNENILNELRKLFCKENEIEISFFKKANEIYIKQ